MFRAMLGPALPVRIEFWDGSGIGAADAIGTARFHSLDGIRRILWSPDELGLGRAFVVGDLDIEGDLFGVLRVLEAEALREPRLEPRAVLAAIVGAGRLGVLGLPP